MATPKKVQGNNEYHTKRAALWDPSVSSPSFSKATRELEAEPNFSMVFKVRMSQPSRQLQPAKDVIQNTTVNRIKKIDNICHKDMQIRIQGTRQRFLKI